MNRLRFSNRFYFFLFLLAWNAALSFAGASLLPYGLDLAAKYLLPLVIWLALRREKPRFLHEEPGGVNVILVIFLSAAIQPMLMLLTAAVGIFAPTEIPFAYGSFNEAGFPASLFLAAAVPALCEGAALRGYMLSANDGAYSVGAPRKTWRVVLLNGLLAALVGLSLSAAPYAFATGAYFALITVCARSFRAGVLAHFCVNAFQFIINRAAGLGGIMSAKTPPAGMPGAAFAGATLVNMQRQVIFNLAIISVIFLPVAAILMRSFLTHNRQENLKRDMKNKLN